MYIVVIGLGEVGRHLLSVLDNEGHDVVAVDASAEAVAYAEEHYDVACILGYGASQDVLDRAGVARADIVVAVSNHDEVNLIAALAAKQLGAKQAVARAQGDEWANWTAGIRYGLLGVDVVINPRVLVAQELARVARSHGASDVIDLSQDRVELVQIELAGESRLFNKALKSIDMPTNALVAAIVRDGVLEVPGGDDVFQKGDRVYLIGSPDGVLSAERLFSRTREARRVCIVGGGVVGKSLARELKRSGAKVMLIEKDRETAEAISIELDGVDVVHGDGTHQGLLEEEEVDSFDLFCAVTPMDEVNLMAALLAKRVGCARTAVTVQRADYVPIYKQLGVDIVLSPRTVASDHILRLSRGGMLHSLTVLENGQAEVVELTVSAHSPAVGRELTKMRDLLPHGALLGAIIHGDLVVIPHGSTKLAAGDRVIVMTKSHARKAVERVFRPRNS